MKKVTIILVFGLLSSTVFYGQATVKWNNKEAKIALGETIPMNITYDMDGGDINYLAVQLRESDKNYGIINSYKFNPAVFKEGKDADTVDFKYTADKDVPTSAELKDGNFYLLLVFAEYIDKDGNKKYVDGNTRVTITEEEE